MNNSQLWPINAQQTVNDLCSTGTEVELSPAGEWTYTNGPYVIPTISANLMINGEDVGEKLIKLGLAEAVN
jgi:hypothetical protein